MTLPGTYSDDRGSTPVTWTIASSVRPGWDGRFEVTGTVRGVRVSGAHFGALERDDPPGSAGQCGGRTGTRYRHGPGSSDHAWCSPWPGTLVIEFRLGEGTYEPLVVARLTVDGAEYSQEREEILEAVLGDLARQIEPQRWECCLTWLLSDYSPGG